MLRVGNEEYDIHQFNRLKTTSFRNKNIFIEKENLSNIKFPINSFNVNFLSITSCSGNTDLSSLRVSRLVEISFCPDMSKLNCRVSEYTIVTLTNVNLNYLPNCFHKLQMLNINSCHSLLKINDIKAKSIKIIDCSSIKEMVGTNIHSDCLNISGCINLEKMNLNIKAKDLVIEDCSSLGKLTLTEDSSVNLLSIKGAHRLRSLSTDLMCMVKAPSMLIRSMKLNTIVLDLF